MVLPFAVVVAGLVSALIGAKKGYDGYKKMDQASEKISKAKKQQHNNKSRLERTSRQAVAAMDRLGEKELEIFSTFDDFSDLVEKIQNKPTFKEINRDSLHIQKYSFSDIKNIAIGAEVLLGGLKGAAAGTAGGFAAAGATTAAVTALGTASTGVAISSLSGVAATNATLAALGGGAIAAGGGGMALGSMVLGVSTLGVGLMIGGLIFSACGDSVLEDAEKAQKELMRETKQVEDICEHFDKLQETADEYYEAFIKVEKHYRNHLKGLSRIVNDEGKFDYKNFTNEEKLIVDNTVMLVGLLYEMGKVKIVTQNTQNDLGVIHREKVSEEIRKSERFLEKNSSLIID